MRFILQRDNRELVGYKHITGKSSQRFFFIHGMGGRQSQWHNQIDYFKRYVDCVTLDLLGHGESGYLSPSELDNPYEVEEYLADLYCWLKKHGCQENIVIGHSMGGLYAYEFACRYAQVLNIKKLILVAPVPIKDSIKKQTEFWSQPLDFLESVRSEMDHYFEKFGFHIETPEAIRQPQLDAAKRNRLDVIKYLNLGLKRDANENSQALETPTLMITSEHDGIVSEKESVDFYRELPIIDMVSVQKSSHFPQLEESGRVNEIIEGWIGLDN